MQMIVQNLARRIWNIIIFIIAKILKELLWMIYFRKDLIKKF